MKRIATLISSLLMTSAIAATSASTPSVAPIDALAPGDFVTVKETHFSRHGHAFYIAGANFWYGGYLGADERGRVRLVKELDRLHALGINNLRVLAVSEQTDMKSAVRPATTAAPGQYDEHLLAGLDVLIAEMSKRNMTAVLYLNNFWQWSGGMTQYLNWFEGSKAHDPNVTKDYDGFMDQNARFYLNQSAQDEYRNVIRKIIERTNTVTGKRYADDPTIMSWQLANEPRPGNDKATPQQKATYIKWVADTAGYIHSIDPHHLVSSGSEGLAGSAQDSRLYLDAHATPQIDYLTYHLWPKNWGWFDSQHPKESWYEAIGKSRAYLHAHIALARTLGKPIVLEEFGLDRDGPSFSIKATTHWRDHFYHEVFDIVVGGAAKGEPIAGFNFWAWGGAGRAANPDFWWKPGDDFLGDPPQEEQGLYSVFDSDASSLKLIKHATESLHELERK